MEVWILKYVWSSFFRVLWCSYLMKGWSRGSLRQNNISHRVELKECVLVNVTVDACLRTGWHICSFKGVVLKLHCMWHGAGCSEPDVNISNGLAFEDCDHEFSSSSWSLLGFRLFFLFTFFFFFYHCFNFISLLIFVLAFNFCFSF